MNVVEPPLFKVLRPFLDNPDRKFFTRELVTSTGVSSATLVKYLAYLENLRVLKHEDVGRTKFYSLANTTFARELKKVYGLYLIESFGANKFVHPGIISLAIIGSFVSGDYDSMSDYDILVIGDKVDLSDVISKFSKYIRRRVELVHFALPEWEGKKRKKDDFVLSILSNHFLIYGEEL